MSNFDNIKDSYDAFRSLRRDIDALVYLANLVPEEDEHQALLFMLADKLDQDSCSLHRNLCPLWAEINSMAEPVKG